MGLQELRGMENSMVSRGNQPVEMPFFTTTARSIIIIIIIIIIIHHHPS